MARREQLAGLAPHLGVARPGPLPERRLARRIVPAEQRAHAPQDRGPRAPLALLHAPQDRQARHEQPRVTRREPPLDGAPCHLGDLGYVIADPGEQKGRGEAIQLAVEPPHSRLPHEPAPQHARHPERRRRRRAERGEPLDVGDTALHKIEAELPVHPPVAERVVERDDQANRLRREDGADALRGRRGLVRARAEQVRRRRQDGRDRRGLRRDQDGGIGEHWGILPPGADGGGKRGSSGDAPRGD